MLSSFGLLQGPYLPFGPPARGGRGSRKRQGGSQKRQSARYGVFVTTPPWHLRPRPWRIRDPPPLLRAGYAASLATAALIPHGRLGGAKCAGGGHQYAKGGHQNAKWLEWRLFPSIQWVFRGCHGGPQVALLKATPLGTVDLEGLA